MGLRGLAGDVARNTSGVWRGIADAVDPDGRRQRRSEHIDLTGGQPSSPAAGPTTEAAAPAGPPEQSDAMLVPLDTWTRILEQVGNVHEAGQQLADAKERAARAETENRFLREQLTELKAKRPTRRASKPAAPAPPPSAAAPVAPASRPADSTPPLTTTEPAIESRVTRVRRRASGWLSP